MKSNLTIEAYFKRIDAWRHFPSYRLENRVDAFFSFYLQEALEVHSQKTILPNIIPELPLRKGTLDTETESNGSKKVDFVLFSDDLETSYFVELKTDSASRGEKQDDYLKTCSGLKFHSILEGIFNIIRKTKKKKKYLHLLKELECIGLMKAPAEIYNYTGTDFNRFLNRSLSLIKIEPLTESMVVEVVYVQPEYDLESTNAISFEMLDLIVSSYDDPISVEMSKYLKDWENPAGEKQPEGLEHIYKCN